MQRSSSQIYLKLDVATFSIFTENYSSQNISVYYLITYNLDHFSLLHTLYFLQLILNVLRCSVLTTFSSSIFSFAHLMLSFNFPRYFLTLAALSTYQFVLCLIVHICSTRFYLHNRPVDLFLIRMTHMCIGTFKFQNVFTFSFSLEVKYPIIIIFFIFFVSIALASMSHLFKTQSWVE